MYVYLRAYDFSTKVLPWIRGVPKGVKTYGALPSLPTVSNETVVVGKICGIVRKVVPQLE